MLLNESLHKYVPTFKRLKQGNTAYGKAPLLFALIWVTCSHGYLRLDDCFKWFLFFLWKNGWNTEGVLCINQTAQYKLVGVYLPLVWTKNILGIGFGKHQQYVCLGFGSGKASGLTSGFIEYRKYFKYIFIFL
jgi:hypothetical protein